MERDTAYLAERAAAAELRAKLRAKLEAEDRDDLAERLAKCGEPIRLHCQDCGNMRDVLTRCDLKWCPSCQRALAARSAQRYAKIAELCKWPLFVTFNCAHTKKDDLTLLRKIRRAHTKLRRLRWWKARVPGGVIAYEVSRLNTAARRQRRIKADAGWHPHGHALIDCRWLAVDECEPAHGASAETWRRKARAACDEVAEQWSLCLGRPGSVAVRRVWRDADQSIGGAIAEVLKYSIDGAKLADSDYAAGPVIDMLMQTRMLCSFGTFHGHTAIRRTHLAPQPCDCGCMNWVPDAVVNAAYHASRKSRR